MQNYYCWPRQAEHHYISPPYPCRYDLHIRALKHLLPASCAAHKSTSDAVAMTFIPSTDPHTSQRFPICGVTQSAVLPDKFCVVCYKIQVTF
jgi:hypothetical protein